MKQYATTMILFSTLLIGEVHTFWEKGNQSLHNWILKIREPMTTQWNVKMATDELIWILYFVSMILYARYPNKVNTNTVKCFLALSVVDFCLYFYNFKTYGYWIVYFCLAIVWIRLNWKTIKLRLFG